MSLDVYLLSDSYEEKCMCSCGHEHIRTRNEPSYSANITHNLNKMAEAAGIYKHLWRPEEIGITFARDLIQPLREGLEMLVRYPDKFEQFNAPNGWGLYVHFVPFVANYLAACEQSPNARVQASA